MNNTPVTLLGTATAYKGFFKINTYTMTVEKFDGTTSQPMTREMFERGQSVGVLPYDPDTRKVLLIRQFLPGAHVAGRPNRPLQIIAGMVEPGKTPVETALRESVEEAGLSVTDVKLLASYLPSPGGTSEYIHLFLAETSLENNQGGIFGLEEEGEDIRVEVMDVEEAIRLVDSGEIESSLAVIALLQLARRLKL